MSHPKSEISGTAADQQSIFSFTYRSIPFRVRLHPDSETTNGTLEATLGLIPYTGDGAALRSNMLAVIDELRRMPDCNIQVGADHAINLSVSLPAQEAPSPAGILADAIGKLATVKSWLDIVLSLQPPHLRRAAQAQSRAAV